MKANSFKPRMKQLAVAWERMTEAERSEVGEMHLHYEHAFAKMAADNPDNLESVAHSIHEGVDHYVRHTIKIHPRSSEITCRKGCAHCCYLNVTITRPEAALLTLVAAEQGIELDRDKLARQAATKQDQEAWHQLPLADRACAFLDPLAGTCRVYEHRPDACRKYHVVSDPSHCDADKHWGHQVLTFVSIEAEVVASAALNVFESGGMAEMLLKSGTDKEYGK